MASSPAAPTSSAVTAAGHAMKIDQIKIKLGVIGCCEEFLTELKIGAFPTPPKDLSLHEAFARFRAEEWDSLRDRYCDVSKEVAVARRPEAGSPGRPPGRITVHPAGASDPAASLRRTRALWPAGVSPAAYWDRSLGSNSSRTASPNRLKPNTARLMAMPGKIAIQGALSAYSSAPP